DHSGPGDDDVRQRGAHRLTSRHVMIVEAGPAGAAGAAALLAKAARLRAWGYPVEVIDRAAAQALEPHLRLDGFAAATFCPQEAWVDAPLCVATVLRAAQLHGAVVRPQTAVAGFLMEGERIAGVSLAGGEPLPAGRVVLATGRWTDAAGRLAGLEVPLAPTCGLLAVSSPLAEGVSRVVHVPGMNFRPDPGGGAVLQSGATDGTVGADTPPDPGLPGCATLLAAVARYLPALAGARIVEARVGVRPMPADGFTLAGAVEARPGLYLTVTHSGVTLGPLLGELAAAEIGGGVEPLLAPFRPQRLVRPLQALDRA
ncbi:MAG TPA: FAD-dependent oxidoreductase, partial [Chloroflexota bacterium]|nr:FAD-dependent oxidoreductase [Chloroflexota bacterium]